MATPIEAEYKSLQQELAIEKAILERKRKELEELIDKCSNTLDEYRRIYALTTQPGYSESDLITQLQVLDQLDESR